MNAVENVAKWLNVSKEDSQKMIQKSMETYNLRKEASFWFLRSLSLNTNTSQKPFEDVSQEEKQKVLDIYCEEHRSLDSKESHWPDYVSAKDYLSRTTIEGFTSKYGDVPSWLYSKNLSSVYTGVNSRYIDSMIYPVFPKNQRVETCFQSVLVNYIVNNYETVCKDYSKEIKEAIAAGFFDNLVEKSFFEKYHSRNQVAVSFVLSEGGISYFIESTLKSDIDILRKAKDYFKKNGYVFPVILPKMPYGFDIILAMNRSFDGIAYSRLWKN
jgi:hypothetical protein